MQKFIHTTVIAAGFTLCFTLLPVGSAQPVHFGAGAGLLAEVSGLTYRRIPPSPPPSAVALALAGPGMPYPKLPPPPPPSAVALTVAGPGMPYPKLPPPPPPSA